MDRSENKICSKELQDFVDCMYLHSDCVSSGKDSLKDCTEKEQAENTMALECTEKNTKFLQCWRQIVI